MKSTDLIGKKVYICQKTELDVTPIQELIDEEVGSDYEFTDDQLKQYILDYFYEYGLVDLQVVIED